MVALMGQVVILGFGMQGNHPEAKGILIKLALAFLAFGLVLFLPTPAGLTSQGKRVLAVVALAVVLWSATALPVAVSSLVVLIVLASTRGVPSVSAAFVGFTSPVVFFLVGILAIGAAVVKTGLADRAARFLLKKAQGSPGRLYINFFLSLPPLALVLPSAITRNAVLIPTYEQVFRTLGIGPEDRLSRAIMLSLGVLHPLVSSAFLTGGMAPMTTATLLGGFSWLRWFALMSVPYFSLLLLGGILIYILNPPKGRDYQKGVELCPPSPGISPDEARVFAVIGFTSLLWLTDFLHGLNPAIPALLAAALLLSPRIGVLGWEDFERSMSWSIFFVLGTSLSLAQALGTSGAASWSAQELVRNLAAFSDRPWAVIVLIITIVGLVHLGITSFAACLSLLIPMVSAFAVSVGLNPLVCGLVVGIAVDAIVLYPAQTATSILAYEGGYFQAKDVLQVGAGLFLLTILVVLFIALPYWRLLGLPLVP